MPTKKTLEILQAFIALKKRKDSMSRKQYVKELMVLKSDLRLHLNNPDISDQQSNTILKLVGVQPK